MVLGLIAITLAAFVILVPGRLFAQKTQDKYGEKFNIVKDTAGVRIVASSGGQYVYVVCPAGILGRVPALTGPGPVPGVRDRPEFRVDPILQTPRTVLVHL